MKDYMKFYIDGQWVEPTGTRTRNVVNPATEEVAGRISMGEKEDVDRAAAAARKAFGSYSRTSREERIDLLERIFACFQARIPDLSAAITAEMGCPVWLAEKAQIPMPLLQINTEIEVLRNFIFEEIRGNTMIRREPTHLVHLLCTMASAVFQGYWASLFQHKLDISADKWIKTTENLCSMLENSCYTWRFEGESFQEMLKLAGKQS